jgi:hypothetical protein
VSRRPAGDGWRESWDAHDHSEADAVQLGMHWMQLRLDRAQLGMDTAQPVVECLNPRLDVVNSGLEGLQPKVDVAKPRWPCFRPERKAMQPWQERSRLKRIGRRAKDCSSQMRPGPGIFPLQQHSREHPCTPAFRPLGAVSSLGRDA